MSRDRLVTWVGVALLPPLLFVIVRPDWYFAQNGVDPWFYSSYVMNFDDMMAVIGGDYYFVTRWTLYLPQRVLFDLFGDPVAAYLSFRWLLWSAIFASIAIIGRHRWRYTDTLAACVLAFTTPIVLRPLFSDYSDAVYAAAGALLLAFVVARPLQRSSALAIGALAAAMAIANPWSLLLICIAGALWLIEMTPRQAGRQATIAIATALTVLAAGWWWYRTRYGIGNVYQSTLDFRPGGVFYIEETRSTNWWWYRLWIWLPWLIIAAMWWARRRQLLTVDRVQATLTGVLALVYGTQCAFQILTPLSTLDLPYYWSLIVAPLLLTSTVLVLDIADRAPRWVMPSVAGAVVLWAALQTGRTPQLLPHWTVGVLLIIIVAAVVVRWGPSRPGWIAVTLVIAPLVIQVGSPRPEPRDEDGFTVDSAYDTVFAPELSPGITGYDAARWFVETIASQPDDVRLNALYWFDDLSFDQRNISTQMAAMYAPHVTDRWWNRSRDRPIVGTPLPADDLAEFQDPALEAVIVLAFEPTSSEVLAMLSSEVPDLEVVLQASPPDHPDLVVTVLTRD